MHRESFLRCPFCDAPIGEPEEIMGKFGNVFSGGRCGCGAVYVYDRSGHNMGDAYVDVLNLACDGDMDRAWALDPEKDYEMLELGYNSRKNKFGSHSKARISRSPVFLFLKLKNKKD